MEAKKLTLTDFRNYIAQTVEFGSGINILLGDNAQGKTNILEAVYLFSMGKASRAHRDVELIRHGQDQAKLSLEFFDGERDCTADIILYKNRRKTVTLNEVPIRKNSELVGRFRVVYFGPEYLGLVKEGPKMRRRNFDILISQLRPRYFSALSDSKKLVDSKNALLKMDKPNLAMLEIINEKLAGVSAELIAYRSEYVRKIGKHAAALQKEISGGQEVLELKYLSCVGDVTGMETHEIKGRLLQKFADSQKRELDARETVVGPHREDIAYFINDQDAKLYASQGQQKSVVLSQKLSEVALIAEETGDLPILLLDDIMSELDKKRRSFILNHIRNMQILITCTDVDGFQMDGEVTLFRVEEGRVQIEN